MKFPLCVLALLLGTAVVEAAPVAEPVAAPVVAELPAEKDGLSVSISAIASDDPWVDGDVLTRNIRLIVSSASVDVVITNTSDKAIRIFQEWNSVGYYNVTLEVTKIDNEVLLKPIIVGKGQGSWFSNAAVSEVIEPGTSIVRHVHLLVPADIDPDASRAALLYRNFPFPTSSKQKRITMRAIFSNKFAVGSENEPIWTGTMASKLLEDKVSLVDDRPKPKPN